MTSDYGEQAEPSRFHGRADRRNAECHQNEAPATSTSTDIAPAQPPVEKAIKRFVRQQVPDSILNDHALNAAIKVLPANYNFEIHKTVWRLRQARAHATALQFPEGLLMYAATIADILERFAGVDHCLIMGDVTYGACCVDDLSAVAMGADFLVHYGHSCLVPVDVTSLPCLYVFVDIAIDVDHLVGCVGLTFTPGTQLVLAGTIQFSTALQLARSALLPAFPALAIPKVAPLSPGEVLGCTAPVLTSAADAIVFVADGRFHLEAIMIANPALPAYRYDPYARQLTREHYDQAGQARHWGLVLGTLGRQGNPHLLDHLRDELQSSGARTTTFLISELSPARLALVPDIDAWVQVACPRLSIDWGEAFTQPCLTPYEALVALGKVPAWWLQSRPLGQGCQHAAGDPPCSASNSSRKAVEGGAGGMGLDEGLQPYPMDYYSKTGGAWNSSWHKGTVGGAGKGRVGGLLPHQKPSAVTLTVLPEMVG
ncbi:hypothetical protein QJQ45_001800 [Haematococcus lacustris]|nr:hypothetical protein QJQ45_001800 [Haematococcus lacustris]